MSTVGTITVTVSVASVVFALADGVLFKPLPYPEAQSLYSLRGMAANGRMGTLSPLDVIQLSTVRSDVFVSGFNFGQPLIDPSQPHVPIGVAAIDQRFFATVGVTPLVGGFTAEMFRASSSAGTPMPAVVSYGLWRRSLQGRPDAVGSVWQTVGAKIHVVGILPKGFVFPNPQVNQVEVLVPYSPPAVADRWSRTLTTIARVRRPVPLEQAQTAFETSLKATVHEYSERKTQVGPYVSVNMRPITQILAEKERPLFAAAFASASLLVMLGAINSVLLFLATLPDRKQTLTMKVTLGATRRRLTRELVGEVVLLASVGGILGWLSASAMLSAALGVLPEGVATLKPVEIDWRVTIFAVLAALLPVAAIASAAVYPLTGPTALARLEDAQRTTRRVLSWPRLLLLTSETAIAVTVVITSALIVKSFAALRSRDAGLEIENLAIVQAWFDRTETPEERLMTEAQALALVQTMPGVLKVATFGAPLYEGSAMSSQFKAPQNVPPFLLSDVPISGEFFRLAGLKLIQGRYLTREETEAGVPNVVISELIANSLWPGESAIGRTLQGSRTSATVVGVVEEARLAAQNEGDNFGEIYISSKLTRISRLNVLMQVPSGPRSVSQRVALAIQGAFPRLLVRRAEALDDTVLRSVRLEYFRFVSFSALGIIVLVLFAIGVAGLVSMGVAARLKEFAIRAALGADRRTLALMSIHSYTLPVGIGLILGCAMSWWTVRFVRAFMYETEIHAPGVWLAATATVVVLTLVASGLSAWRVGSQDLARVLKAE